MSRSNTASTSNWFSVAAPVTTTPLTMACWFYAANITAFHTLMALSEEAGPEDYHVLAADGSTAGDPVQAISQSGPVAEAIASTSTGYSANTWAHACAVFTSSASRTAYINGGSAATNTTDRPAAGIDVLAVGAGRFSSATWSPISGRIAEAAIWNVALTAGEVATLAAGFSPLRVRPAALQGYWPLFARSGNAPDYSGGTALTQNGTMGLANHAVVGPMFGFDLGWMGAFTAGGAPAAGQPYQKRLGGIPGMGNVQPGFTHTW